MDMDGEGRVDRGGVDDARGALHEPPDEAGLLVRISSLAAGTALLTMSIYFWWFGGYMNPVIMALQWIYALAGGAFIIRSLLTSNGNGLLEGRGGLLVSSLLLITLAYFMLSYGVGVSYRLVEIYLGGFAAAVALNSLSRPPLLQRPRVANMAAVVVLALISLGLATYSLGKWPFTALFLLVSLLAVVGFVKGGKGRIVRSLPILFIVELAAAALLLAKGFPQLSSDELVIDAYAAHLAMMGTNPYTAPSLTAALAFFHIPFSTAFSFMTPLTTGGFVGGLSYPALSFLIYVPALLAGLDPRVILFLLTFVLLSVIIIRYGRSGLWGLALIALLVILLDPNAVFYPLTSVTDAGWALLLALSLLFRRRPWISGALFGLSLAFKQIPLVVLPFYLYMVYREGGKGAAGSFTAAGVAAFLATNAPFLVATPSAWLSAVISPEGGRLIGIGQGAGAISFLGYYQLPYDYFLAMEGLMVIALFILYVLKYDRYRYAFLAFPIFIFFFNYRDLFNYIVYWPVLAVAVLPDVGSSLHVAASGISRAVSRRNVEALLVATVVAISVGAAVYAHETTARQSSEMISISAVGGFSNPLGVEGSVTSMTVNITSSLPAVQFRLFSEGELVSGNGLLWYAVNSSAGAGWTVYTIEPESQAMALPYNSTRFRVEAYYGGYQAFYSGFL